MDEIEIRVLRDHGTDPWREAGEIFTAPKVAAGSLVGRGLCELLNPSDLIHIASLMPEPARYLVGNAPSEDSASSEDAAPVRAPINKKIKA
jgi:hypothetical protein